MKFRGSAALLSVALLLTGCAARKYHAAPISPPATADKFEVRSLNDPGLREFITKNLARPPESWPPNAWDPAELTLAALYFHPDLNVARAGVKVAEAGIITAGARPNPSVRVAPGGSTSPENPWLFGTTFTLPIVTAGKRGYQIEAAQRQSDAARLQLAQTAWQVRARLRLALLDLLSTQATLDLLRQEEQVRTEMVRLIQRRVEIGDLPSPELTTARIDLQNIILQARAAETQLRQATPALATAIGVPESALSGAQFVWLDFDSPPASESLALAQIQRTAVLNRLDLRGLLADYAAAESALQLEVAKQYPDIQLGPGYNFEEGSHFFTLGLSATLPIFNRNQGPIAEAEAKREQAGDRFLALQAQILGETQKALASYQGALVQLQDSDRLVQEQAERERQAAHAFDAGETDNLTYTGVRLQSVTTARARLGAVRAAEVALGDLENAVERPLQASWDFPRLPSSSNPSTDLVKDKPK